MSSIGSRPVENARVDFAPYGCCPSTFHLTVMPMRDLQFLTRLAADTKIRRNRPVKGGVHVSPPFAPSAHPEYFSLFCSRESEDMRSCKKARMRLSCFALLM